MSDLSPSMIVLDKGLNLQVPKITAPPGTALDSLNYEQVDFQGQKRIDGYVRYDGSLGSYQDTFMVITFNDVPTVGVGEVVTNQTEPVGIVVSVDAPSITIAIIDETVIPAVGSPLYAVDSGINVGTVTGTADLRTVIPNPEDYYTAVLSYNQIIRSRTTELPGPVAGLHWFRDRLYAVASVIKIDVGPDHGYMPNDVYILPSGNSVDVLKVEEEYIYISGTDTTGLSVQVSDMANLFQSRSEEQAQRELDDAGLYGWDFIHLGWLVPFEEAISLYGSLPSLNQNIQDVGVQGPTSTTGSNGKALVVKQKTPISGKPAQKNGWKGSDTPTNYSLNAANIAEIDSLSIYADAFISWNSTNNTISAPGITGTIPEYSPTNTVQVKV